MAIFKNTKGQDVEPIFVTYSDATYEYFCEAAPGTSRSTPAWQVSRKTIATGDVIPAGDGSASYQATNIATVAALTYTLGA